MTLWLLQLILHLRIAAIFSVLTVWIYILLIGMPVSAVRAGIMILVGTWGMLFGRSVFSWANYWLAFALILGIDPGMIRAPGFILSFSALGGILFFLPSIDRLLQKVNREKSR